MDARRQFLSLLIDLDPDVHDLVYAVDDNVATTARLSAEVAGQVAWQDPSGKWLRVRFSKWLNKLYMAAGLKVDPKQIEGLATAWGALIEKYFGDYRLEVLTGQAIADAYAYFSHVDGLSSCMTGNSSKYVELYVMSPNVELWIVTDKNGKALARALSWKRVMDTKGNRFAALDRIYYSSGGAGVYLANTALERDMAFRPLGWSWLDIYSDDAAAFIYRQARVRKAWTMLGTYERPSYWPYMDTFPYMCWEGEGLVLASYRRSSWFGVARNTDGRLCEENYQWNQHQCFVCGVEMPRFGVCESCRVQWREVNHGVSSAVGTVPGR